MAEGSIATRILTDIGNAIRYQAGVATTYTPGEMAAAVAALDGSNAGNYQAQSYKQLAAGYIPESVFDDIADAIRGQNGTNTTYKPGEMAQAILDLTWNKLRAYLFSDGTLEINYYPSAQYTHSGTPTNTYEDVPFDCDRAVYVPWYSELSSIHSVVFDASVANAVADGLYSIAHWFHYADLTSVTGFAHLSGITNLDSAFSHNYNLLSLSLCGFTLGANANLSSTFYYCTSLATIFADSTWTLPSGAYGTDTFGYDSNLAGGAGTSFSSGHYDYDYMVCDDAGTPGYLTKAVLAFRALQHTDGTLEYTYLASPETQIGGTVSKINLINMAGYNDYERWPTHNNCAQYTRVVIHPSVANAVTDGFTNAYAMFHSFTNVTSYSGLQYLSGITNCESLFQSNKLVTTIDFSGFDFSTVTNIRRMFLTCLALTTIRVPSTFSHSVPNTTANFEDWCYNCSHLVGGNGTAYNLWNVSLAYFCIDTSATPGYLTAASS